MAAGRNACSASSGSTCRCRAPSRCPSPPSTASPPARCRTWAGSSRRSGPRRSCACAPPRRIPTGAGRGRSSISGSTMRASMTSPGRSAGTRRPGYTCASSSPTRSMSRGSTPTCSRMSPTIPNRGSARRCAPMRTRPRRAFRRTRRRSSRRCCARWRGPGKGRARGSAAGQGRAARGGAGPRGAAARPRHRAGESGSGVMQLVDSRTGARQVTGRYLGQSQGRDALRVGEDALYLTRDPRGPSLEDLAPGAFAEILAHTAGCARPCARRCRPSSPSRTAASGSSTGCAWPAARGRRSRSRWRWPRTGSSRARRR